MVCFKSLKNIGACQGLKEQQDANLDAKVGYFYHEICENKSEKYMDTLETLYLLFWCSDLIDDDITDDVKCVLTIYNEHEGLSGNGFNAWLVSFLIYFAIQSVSMFIIYSFDVFLISFEITFTPLRA